MSSAHGAWPKKSYGYHDVDFQFSDARLRGVPKTPPRSMNWKTTWEWRTRFLTLHLFKIVPSTWLILKEKKSGQRQIQLTQQVSFPVTWICQFLHLNSTSLHQKSLSQRHQGRDDGLSPCFTFSIDDIEMISSRDFHLSAELDAQCKWLWLTIEDKKLQGALKNLRCWINLGSQIVIFSFKKRSKRF